MTKAVWFWTSVAVLAAIWIFKTFMNKSSKRLPPSPRRLPILGHLHLIGKNPHQDMHKLAKIYGPIMHLGVGFVDHIIISSPQAAELFLKIHDLNFASRPPQQAPKHMAYDQKGLVFAEYGPYWRNMRKLCSLELLSNHKIMSFQSMRREETYLLIESIKKAAKDGEVVDLSGKVCSAITSMSCRMVFGRKYEDKDIDEMGFKAVFNEVMYLAAAPNLGDFFPYLDKLDIQGLTRRAKAVGKLMDKFFEKIIDEHEQATNKGGNQSNKDFIDTMLEIMKSGEVPFQFTIEHIKSVMMDLLLGSTDTSTTAIEWIMSELLSHPEVTKKVKEELERHVGLDRMVEEKDLESLEYLEMVIKESLRLHPVGPFLIHAAIEDCVVNGFHIPKNARIIVNVWAIGRDPNTWKNPEKFIPERFNLSNVDFKGQHFEFIPFGSGRRICPGLQLGITMVRLLVAQLVHCFDWDLPNGTLPNELDMTEKFGLALTRANHLMAVPTYRLNI